MARRPSLIKIKSKAVKKTKSEQYIINHKGFGAEPIFTDKPILDKQLCRFYNWYNAMCDIKEAKEYIATYLKNTGRDVEAKKLKDVPDKWIPTTVAWIARMRSQGAKLPQTSLDFFEDRLQTAIQRDYRRAAEEDSDLEGGTNPPAKKVAQKPSVQDRMKVLLDGMICDLEEELDKFITTWEPGFSMYSWLQTNEVPPVQAKRIHDYYNPQLLEIEDYVEGRLTEGYDAYSKDNLMKLFGFMVMIVEDIELYNQNEKKVRKPRTPKPVSVDKKLKDFKHQQYDNTLKIQSIQADKLLGSAELWTFSTKYNQLTVFRMKEMSNGLDVHRTAIINYDEKTSMTKKIRSNHVEAVLKEVLNGGKIALRKIMENTKGSEQKLQIRMNENTLLLRSVAR